MAVASIIHLSNAGGAKRRMIRGLFVALGTVLFWDNLSHHFASPPPPHCSVPPLSRPGPRQWPVCVSQPRNLLCRRDVLGVRGSFLRGLSCSPPRERGSPRPAFILCSPRREAPAQSAIFPCASDTSPFGEVSFSLVPNLNGIQCLSVFSLLQETWWFCRPRCFVSYRTFAPRAPWAQLAAGCDRPLSLSKRAHGESISVAPV